MGKTNESFMVPVTESVVTPDAVRRRPRDWRAAAFPVALLVLCGALFFWRLGVTPLDDFDESYYAEGAREMLARGDPWVPYFNGEPFLLKPILIFWLNAASFSLFGVTEFAARAPSAFFATVGVLATYAFGATVLTRRTGLFAGLALALSYLWIDTAREGMTDMPLTAALAGAIFLLFLATRSPLHSRRWLYLSCYPLIGVALLVKGPVVTGVVIIGLLAYLAASGRLVRTLAEAQVLPGLAIVLAVAAPWYLYVAGRHPEFAGTFFVREHLGHLQGELARSHAWWGHLKNLLVRFYPWVAFLPAALAEAFQERDRTHVLRLCAWWALAVVLIYSLAGSKLPHYLLPAFPPMALLVGAWLDAWSRRASPSSRGAALGLSVLAAGGVVCVAGLVIALGCREWLQQKVTAQHGSWEVGAAPVVILAALALGSFGALIAAATGRRRALVPLLGGAMAAAVAAHIGWFKPHLAEIQAQPRKELAQLASAALGEMEPLGVFYAKRPATTFYARRPITDLGEDRPALLAAFLSSPSPATALTHVKCLEALRDVQGEVQVWTRRGDYVLVSNHALEHYFK